MSEALKNPCLVTAKTALPWCDGDGGIDEFQTLGGLARLMQQEAKQVQGIGMLRVCLEHLLIKRSCSREITGLMLLQRLMKQSLRAFVRHISP